MTGRNRVVIETGNKKVFATAIDWPGWSRSGKSEADALGMLADYAERYRRVAGLAGAGPLPERFEVVERLDGSGATDFGVPDRVAEADHEPMSDAECERQLALLRACWSVFDDVASIVSAELRKGPRGGGRDRDKIVDHVVQADRGYGRQIGVRTPPFDSFDAEAVRAHHEAIFAAIPLLRDGEPVKVNGWPVRYFIRRAAWHVMDHAWEMEDKDLTGKET
jgi:hypothetical protein